MYKNILLPVDLSDTVSSERALVAALDLTKPQTTLHVVSVLPLFGSSQVSGFFAPDFEKRALARLGETLCAWIQTHVPADINARPHVLHGTVYHEVLSAADQLQADLIVIGAHRPELKDYFLGPNAARIVRHAKPSVFVVRNETHHG